MDWPICAAKRLGACDGDDGSHRISRVRASLVRLVVWRAEEHGAYWMSSNSYQDFLEAKVAAAPSFGFDVVPSSLNPALILHQPIIVEACVRGGRRAVFAKFGLGKTVMDLEIVRICAEHERSRGLIILPLGVR